MDYVEAASELGQAITASNEFKTYQEAEHALMHDEKGQQLMMEYRDLQQEMVDKSGQEDLSKEDLEAIRNTLLEKNKELDEYEITGNYFKARQGFDVMMKTINEILSYNIEGASHHDCGGDCGHCGGCH